MLIEKFEVHEELNTKLWESNNQLREDVQKKILEIVDQFLSTCEIPLHIVDIRIVGSQASFNYTKNSDLDVHIVTNFELMQCSNDILQAAFNSIKAKFNTEYDITIRGIDVELYVEDIRSNVRSNGVYSVTNSSWIKFPRKLTNVPVVDVSNEVDEWTTIIEQTLQLEDSDAVESLIDELYIIRKDSLEEQGEYGSGNQLFKELRNIGLLDKLKEKYKEFKSKELSLESLQKQKLTEASRQTLLAKSKKTNKGFERFKKRVKSRVANSVKQYNAIDMNKLFKYDILTADINVKGETDSYTVKISFGGFLELLQDQLAKQNNVLDYKAVTRALINGFNKDDVYISCSCEDWKYRFAYFATRNDITSGVPENRPSDITNPDDNLGSACKHVLLVLSNTSFLLKIASTIYNYINYMKKHYEKLYADIIYPAIYGTAYEEPVQLSIEDNNELDSSADQLDQSNEYARTKNQFKQGNKQGIRFDANELDSQISLDDDDLSGDIQAQ